MLAGAPYDPRDPQLAADRFAARRLCNEFADIDVSDTSAKRAVLTRLLGRNTNADISAPFHCDYGYNLRLGANVYFNVGCVVLDVMPISIGRDVLIGPGVHLYAAMHPMEAGARRSGLEFGKPVVIGDDVWIGGQSVVCPGVTIGDGAMIGAGSVVTRDIPAGVFAAGNPCRVIRAIADPG